MCIFSSLVLTACDQSPLVAAGFLFLGFSAAPPCKVGRLSFPNCAFKASRRKKKEKERRKKVGRLLPFPLCGLLCYFDGVAFHGFLRIPRILGSVPRLSNLSPKRDTAPPGRRPPASRRRSAGTPRSRAPAASRPPAVPGPSPRT